MLGKGVPNWWRWVAIYHDDVIKWKLFPRYWLFVRGIHRSPRKGQWRGAFMFSLICTRITGWVNNRWNGDLRCHRAHYDVIVMYPSTLVTAPAYELWMPQHWFQVFHLLPSSINKYTLCLWYIYMHWSAMWFVHLSHAYLTFMVICFLWFLRLWYG